MLAGLFEWISGEFAGVRNFRFWAKSLGYSPCFWTWRILASVGNRSKPSWKDSYMVANGFLIACGTIWMDFGWIRWGPNLADFEQKAWAIAHAFEHGGFWQVLEIARNFLKGLLYTCKWISKSLRNYLNGFLVNSLGSEIGRFWAKRLGYSPCFWTWRILASVENRSNLPERLLCACKWISKCLRYFLNGFRVNSLGCEIGRFWAKSMGYSPCFWTWRILASVGNRSNLPESTPIWFQMDF